MRVRSALRRRPRPTPLDLAFCSRLASSSGVRMFNVAIVVLLPALYAYRQGKLYTFDYRYSPQRKPSQSRPEVAAERRSGIKGRRTCAALVPEQAKRRMSRWLEGFRRPEPIDGDNVRIGEQPYEAILRARPDLILAARQSYSGG
jgi:hypothetical protein